MAQRRFSQAPLLQTQVSSYCTVLHQRAEDEEISFLEGVDEVEQTLYGVDDL
jgi:hypothetical protein